MPTRRHVDELSPYRCVFAGRSRVNIIIPSFLAGPVITIRKFIKEFGSIEDLVTLDTLSRDMAIFDERLSG